jgi:hypothetical protein
MSIECIPCGCIKDDEEGEYTMNKLQKLPTSPRDVEGIIAWSVECRAERE